MRKSTIPFLLINLVFLVISCGSSPVKDLTKVALEHPVYESGYFADPKTDYVYKTNISVYGNELSGIFIAKKTNDTIHRVVFTTEFGNKLLDFEISENAYKINSIVDELDRSMLINTLVADFRLLLREKYNIQQQFETTESKVLLSKDGNRNNYLFVSKTGGNLSEIRHASKRKEKINISYISENNIFADKIIIQHYNLKLRIEFNYLKNP